MTGNEWREWLTFGLAVLGAGLGVFNAWKGWIADRVRLQVVPLFTKDTTGESYISIEVRNLSAFPVTVTAIGFTVVGGATHLQIPHPVFIGFDKLPVRLVSRTALTSLTPLIAFEESQVVTIDAAYVKTACGLQVKGGRKALRKILQTAFAARQPHFLQ